MGGYMHPQVKECTMLLNYEKSRKPSMQIFRLDQIILEDLRYTRRLFWHRGRYERPDPLVRVAP